MPRSSLTIDQVLTLLEDTPRRIAAATRDLRDAQLQRSPAHREWSANEVLAHLRACADARGEPIRTILAEDHPTFRAVNPLTWLKGPTTSPWHSGRRSVLSVTSVSPSWRCSSLCRAVAGPVQRPLREPELRSSGLCSSTRSGWPAMNGRTSSRSSAS